MCARHASVSTPAGRWSSKTYTRFDKRAPAADMVSLVRHAIVTERRRQTEASGTDSLALIADKLPHLQCLRPPLVGTLSDAPPGQYIARPISHAPHARPASRRRYPSGRAAHTSRRTMVFVSGERRHATRYLPTPTITVTRCRC